MRFKADRYILEQMWSKFGATFEETVSTIGFERINFERFNFDAFSARFEGTTIYAEEDEEGVYLGNDCFYFFPPGIDSIELLSLAVISWMKENYPEYLI